MTYQAYAAPEARAPLMPRQLTDERELGPTGVEIAVEACALCHSDLHLVDDDWGISRFPLVPGHEVVGRVARAGAASGFQVGERVGVGWQCGACGACRPCRSGQAQLCTGGKRRTCVDQAGGLAERVRTDAAFTFRIPAELTSVEAAPLLCAGVTVYAPLRRLLTRPGLRVGVVGIGGLGHLAVQVAKALGAEVTAFDPVAAKAEEARRLGAARFVATADVRPRSGLDGELDVILTTTHVDLDWNLWLSQLALGGTMCLVGVPKAALTLDPGQLLDGQKSVTGSVIGSPDDMRGLLALAATSGIRPVVETLPLARVNEAIDRVRRGAARYRVVLTVKEAPASPGSPK